MSAASRVAYISPPPFPSISIFTQSAASVRLNPTPISFLTSSSVLMLSLSAAWPLPIPSLSATRTFVPFGLTMQLSPVTSLNRFGISAVPMRTSNRLLRLGSAAVSLSNRLAIQQSWRPISASLLFWETSYSTSASALALTLSCSMLTAAAGFFAVSLSPLPALPTVTFLRSGLRFIIPRHTASAHISIMHSPSI